MSGEKPGNTGNEEVLARLRELQKKINGAEQGTFLPAEPSVEPVRAETEPVTPPSPQFTPEDTQHFSVEADNASRASEPAVEAPSEPVFADYSEPVIRSQNADEKDDFEFLYADAQSNQEINTGVAAAHVRADESGIFGTAFNVSDGNGTEVKNGGRRGGRGLAAGVAAAVALGAAWFATSNEGSSAEQNNESPEVVLASPSAKPKETKKEEPKAKETQEAKPSPKVKPSPTNNKETAPVVEPVPAPEPTPELPENLPPITEAMKMEYVKALPLEAKINQKLMLGIEDEDELEKYADLFNKHYVGSVILMDEMPRATIKAFEANQAAPITICTDQEGGRVQRFDSMGTMPSAARVAKTQSPQEAYGTYYRNYSILDWAGVDCVLGPVADVASKDYALGNRSYGSNPKKVGRYVEANIEAAQDAGLTSVVKHFVMGTADRNTDKRANVKTAKWAKIQKRGDLLPYQKVADLNPHIMMSNADIPGLTKGQPASLSQNAVEAVRAMKGYEDAVIMTDGLNAKAVVNFTKNGTTIAEATAEAFEAGNDLALIVNPGGDLSWKQQIEQVQATVKAAIKSKNYSKDELNQSALRILEDKGLFDPESANFDVAILEFVGAKKDGQKDKDDQKQAQDTEPTDAPKEATSTEGAKAATTKKEDTTTNKTRR